MSTNLAIEVEKEKKEDHYGWSKVFHMRELAEVLGANSETLISHGIEPQLAILAGRVHDIGRHEESLWN